MGVMNSGRGNAVMHPLERLLQRGTLTGLSEGQLLDRFATMRDESAFEALMERHGPMVLGVCRQFLRDPNDVDDAFQATFLVLVRKAGSLRRQDLLGNWLYGVACRVAMRARTVTGRRQARAAPVPDIAGFSGDGRSETPASGADAVVQAEQRPVVLEEVNRLPDRYREPIVLCYLEGMTHEEAATQLGWPLGTVKGRLSRARDLLGTRLTRRGFALATPALLAALGTDLEAAVPVPLVMSTLRAALAVSTRGGAALLATSAVSFPAATLAKGVLKTMFLARVRSLAITALVAGGAVTYGVGVVAYQPAGTAPAGRSPISTQEKGTNVATKAEPPPQQSRRSEGAGSNRVPSPPASPPQPAPPPAPAQAGSGGGAAVGGALLESNASYITIARMAATVSRFDKNPMSQEILKKLNRPIAMNFPNEAPLEEVLKYVKQANQGPNDSGIPIYVDPLGLQEADKTMTSPVIIDLEGVPLRFSLRLLLKQLGLAYCVHDGVLIISSVEGICRELEEAQAEVEGANTPNPAGNPLQ